MNVQAKRAIWFGIAHLIVLVACYFAAFTLSMERFDKYDAQVSAVEYVSASLSEILMFPGRYIWTSWASKNLHNAFEWMLLIANSSLWGVALSYVFGKLKRAT